MGDRVSAGVAMCVFNGIRYLEEQLKSIAGQTELPSLMIIVDDGSTDGSWELIQSWAAVSCFPVEARRNTSRLGVVRNFELAISCLHTEIIFLADQDDVWYPDKLVNLVDRFTAEPNLGLVHSNADLIDGEGRPLNRSLMDALLVTELERKAVSDGNAYRVYAKRNLVTGAACAFRRSYLIAVLPFPSNWVHDEWLAFCISLVAKIEMLDISTMAYRLHGSNTVGLPLPSWVWRVQTIWRALWEPSAPRQRERALRLGGLLVQARKIGAERAMLDYIAAACEHARFRANLPSNPLTRLRRVLAARDAGDYHAWSSGRTSVLHDILLAN